MKSVIQPLYLGTAMALLAWSSGASAQATRDADADGVAEQPGEANNASALNTIVVTAQRREQDATRVPISIEVIGGEVIADTAISTLEEVTLSVPNFQITQTGLTTQTYIRGIGSGNDPAFEQSVAQFVDGVSYGRAQLTRAPIFDLQRVEVLRGPQSILFGKNSTAGALSIITAQPTDLLEAGATTTYTPVFDSFEGQAFVSGPLADGLSGRLAIRGLTEKGYVFNTVKGRNDPHRDEIAGRATVRYEDGNFAATLKGEYSKFDVDGRNLLVSQDVATRNAAPGVPLTFATALAGAGLPSALQDTSFNYRRQVEADEFDDTEFYNGTLTTETDFGAATLTTVTGYLGYDRDTSVDLDFTSASILGGLTRESYKQISQEIRVATDDSLPLSVIAGAYFEHNQLDYSDVTALGSNLANLGFGVIADIAAVRDFEQTSDTYSVFAQVQWRVAENLRVIPGLRVAIDDKTASRSLVARNGAFSFDGPLVSGAVPITVLQTALGFSLDNPVAGVGHDLSRSRSEKNVVPSLAVEMDVTDDILLFASYREGYKGFGFDARSNNNTSFGFDDEEVSSYEVGLRASLPGNRASFGLTLYRSTYSDLQISQFDGTVGFNVGNAGRTRSQGVEANARYAIAPGIALNASAAYLDFEYLDFRRGNCAFGETPDGDVVNGVQLCDYTGRRGRFTPELNFYGGLSVDRPLFGNLRLKVNANASYTGEHNVHDNLDPAGQVEGYTIVDARIGVGGDNWTIAAVGKNLLDERFRTYAAQVPFASNVGANTQYATASRPRSVAIQLQLRY
ncbi:MAG: TonB-dependent receptor [Sphingomonadales bacterium]|jgi:iron complex outermembrane receptor protein